MVITDEIDVAQLALRQYDIGTDATLRLLNLSENATYLVEDGSTRSILRVHRQDYHRPHEIESELDWLQALQTDSDVTVPSVLPASDGRRLVTVQGEETGGIARHVVHFGMDAGAEPDEGSLTALTFGKWGVDLDARDPSVKPGDDFDKYANGGWFARTEIPADQASAGVDYDVYNLTQRQLRQVVTGAAGTSQVGGLYQSFADEARVAAGVREDRLGRPALMGEGQGDNILGI